MVELYHKTWEIAAGRVRKGPEGLPASPYLDENCYEDQIWIWDTCFMVLFAKYAPKHFPGVESLDNLYKPMHEGAATPLRIHWPDNPPLFAWTEREYFKFTGDKARLDKILNKKRYLQKHFDWFAGVKAGDSMPCSPQRTQLNAVGEDGFTWSGRASGMDNTPRGRDAGGYDKILWVDAIAQQALSAHCMAEMHLSLGNKPEAASWQKRYETLKRKINTLYWDEKDGFYYDIAVSDKQPCRLKTPASYWPLLAQVASPEQARRMVAHLMNPDEFGGQYPVPTLARSDKEYNHQTGDYWKGGIWLPMTYMCVKALETYGYYKEADDIAEKMIHQQLATYKKVEPHTIWECYSPGADEPSTEHGRRVRPDFCGWSALGPIALFIENVLGFREVSAAANEVNWCLNKSKGMHGIRNLSFGGVTTDIVYDGKNTVTVKSNKPYTLIINGKKHSIRQGTTTLNVK